MKQDKIIRIIVDTNLWISFLIGRKLACLTELLSFPTIQLVVSSELINEICDVFTRPKLAKYYSKENLEDLVTFMNNHAISYSLGKIPTRCRDPKDDYLLELAVQTNADFLITGDNDLLDMRRIGDCHIVTAMEFDIISASWGKPTTLHEGLKEFYAIVTSSKLTRK